MSDKPTAELKADLRAEREYLESGLPAFRARACRNRIREMEAELEARGENTLAVHEDNGDGTALCGQGLKDWTDPKTGIRWRSMWMRHGPGPVDCGKCANVSGEPTGYEPLAEPQGESVRTVTGGAFETNRQRH